jgi:hypothetical protein
VHEVISQAVAAYVDDPNWSKADMAARLEQGMLDVRADIQPEAVAAMRASIWGLAELIVSQNPNDILRFDGGREERTGQVARDIQMGGTTYRLTSEVDLLLSTESPDILEEIDHKSGWTPYDESAVRDAFQFQTHAYILLELYPGMKALDVRVWRLRDGRPTYRARFERRHLATIGPRILSALEAYHRWRDAAPHEAPAHPLEAKCANCPHAIECMDASPTIGTGTPESVVDWLVVAEAASALATEHLNRAVAARGRDIETAFGNRFGPGKPRKATSGLYSTQSAAADASGDEA